MKKILLIILSVFIFSGCAGVYINKDFSLIEQDNFKEKKDLFFYGEIIGYSSFMMYGIIPYNQNNWKIKFFPFKNYIKLKIESIYDLENININNFVIKKNNKKINKDIKFFRYFSNKDDKKNIFFYSEYFSLYSKNEDIIEIIFDLSIKIKDKVINKNVNFKFKTNKRKGIGFSIQ